MLAEYRSGLANVRQGSLLLSVRSNVIHLPRVMIDSPKLYLWVMIYDNNNISCRCAPSLDSLWVLIKLQHFTEVQKLAQASGMLN